MTCRRRWLIGERSMTLRRRYNPAWRLAAGLAMLLAASAAWCSLAGAQTPIVLPPSGEMTIRELAAIVQAEQRQTQQRFSDFQRAIDNALAAQDKQTAQALSAQDKQTAAAFVAAGTAVNKAEVAGEKRFEGMNEFRNQLKDQAATFVTRIELITTVVGLGGLLLAALTYMRRRDEAPRRYVRAGEGGTDGGGAL